MVRVLGPGNISITSPTVASPVRATSDAFGGQQAEALQQAGQAVARVGQALRVMKDEQQGATDKAFLDRYDLETDLAYGAAADEEEKSVAPGADGLTDRVRQRLDDSAPAVLEKVRGAGFAPSEKALQEAESIRLRRQHQYVRRAAVFENNERVRNFSTQLDSSLGTIAQQGVASGDVDAAITRAEQSITSHEGVLPPASLDQMRERAAKYFVEQLKAGGDPDALESTVSRLLRGDAPEASPADAAAAAAGRGKADASGGEKPRAAARRNDAIARAAQATGADEAVMRIFSRIESGDRPGARTGSYKGRFQLSDSEFAKYGGGNIYDDDDNSLAAARKFVAEAAQFEAKHGRKPSALDLYLVHQQGEGGYAAHMARPDALAWQNMASTAEGRRKGSAWAKRAIWGNIPDDVKRQFGKVENVTSADFVDVWRKKVARFGGADVGQLAQPLTLRSALATEIASQQPQFQALIEKRREKVELQQRARAILSGAELVDPNSKADRDTLDKVVKAVEMPDGLAAADPRAADQLTMLVRNAGLVPDAAISQLRASAVNGTTEQRAFALETAANLMREKPGALEGTDQAKELRDDARLYETLTLDAGIGADEALSRIAEMRTPEFAKRREALKKELAEGGTASPIAQLAPADIAADYDGWFTSAPELGGSPRQAALVFDTYRDLVKNHYVRTGGDIEIAKAMAKKELRNVYDVSEITGNRRLMRYPPEKYYPPLAPRAGQTPDHSYFTDQLQGAVDDYVRAGARDFGQANPEARAAAMTAQEKKLSTIPLTDIFLEPIPETNADIKAGRMPGYAVVWFEERDGIRVLQTAPGMVFRADVKAARERERINQTARDVYARKNEVAVDRMWAGEKRRMLEGQPAPDLQAEAEARGAQPRITIGN